MRTNIKSHKAIVLEYENKVNETEAYKMLSNFNIEKFHVDGRRIHVLFIKRQLMNAWNDYHLESQQLMNYAILG